MQKKKGEKGPTKYAVSMNPLEGGISGNSSASSTTQRLRPIAGSPIHDERLNPNNVLPAPHTFTKKFVQWWQQRRRLPRPSWAIIWSFLWCANQTLNFVDQAHIAWHYYIIFSAPKKLCISIERMPFTSRLRQNLSCFALYHLQGYVPCCIVISIEQAYHYNRIPSSSSKSANRHDYKNSGPIIKYFWLLCVVTQCSEY